MSNKKPTLKDVASKAGVAVSTVSYVINNNSSISDVVKKRVFKVIEQLGYVPNSSAQNMRTGRSMIIGLVIPDIVNPFFPELAQSVENSAREYGYSTIIVDTNLDNKIESESIDRLIECGVDGIVCFPTSQIDPFQDKNTKIPKVIIDRLLNKYDTVIPNHKQGGKLQAEYLLSLGHKKIGMINGPLNVDNMKLRRDGFIDEIADKAEIVWEVENPFSMEITSEVKKHLLKNDVTAIVSGNDMIAIGAMEFLKESNIKIPEEISLVGFDNIPWGQWLSSKLTTISLPVSELGSEAVRFLLRRINRPTAPILNLSIDVNMVIRESVTSRN